MDTVIRPARINKLGFSPSSSPPSATRNTVPPSDRRRSSGVLVRCSYNNYSVLGLTPFASKDDVKSAYRRLALKYHPDVARGANGGENQQTFLEIKSAYENLMNSYDRKHQRKYVERQAAPVKTTRRSRDEWDDWDEWMGFEGAANHATYHAYY